MALSARYANAKHYNAYTSGGGTSSNTPPRKNRSATANNSLSKNTNAPSDKNTKKSHTAIIPAAGAGGGATNTSPPDTHTTQAQLTHKLSQYTRGSDRRQVLRSLADPALLPRIHPLKAVWVEDIAAAEREAAMERALLNGVKFLQVKHVPNFDETRDDQPPIDSYFLQTLREICGHMCDMDGVDADPMALYGGLLLRLARTISERDALETVTRWCCGKGELVVLPLQRRHHGPIVDDKKKRMERINSISGSTNKSATTTTQQQQHLPAVPIPIDVELYVESGNVHAKVTLSHELGVYKRTDLENQGFQRNLSAWSALVLSHRDAVMQSSSWKKISQIQYDIVRSSKFSNARPWVFVTADVVERINFGTGSSVRMLHLNLPGDKNSGYVKKW
mmetsp:Transcript_6852/g.15151  ORF Transcript_6852/g.15151 Transcript_6852/m.15151 type:complete len:392 (+) Transcript_6852:189-1364(+)